MEFEKPEEKTTFIYQNNPDTFTFIKEKFVPLPVGYFKVYESYGRYLLQNVPYKTAKKWSAQQQQILDKATKFWEAAEKYREMGFVHQRGFLLQGPAGTGKSTALTGLIDHVIQDEGIALQLYEVDAMEHAIRHVREISDTKKIIVIIEDIDQYVDMDDGEVNEELLNLLSGVTKTDNIMFIATTNYYEKLPDRLKRAGRFDEHIEVEAISIDEKEEYLKRHNIEVTDEIREEIKDKTIAELQEWLIRRVILND